MKRPRTLTPRRARSTAGTVVHSRKEAAIQLVRLEFDASRIELAAEQAHRRLATHRAEAEAIEARRRALLTALKP